MAYGDGGVYAGGWREGLRHDNGSMKWANGDAYEGGWKRDLMDGLGKFTHRDGKVTKGTFKCNYFVEGETLRNPFLGEEEGKEEAERRKSLLKIKERVSKQQLCFFERVKCEDYEAVRAAIRKSNDNNRVPLIFPSTGMDSSTGLFGQYSDATGQPHEIFDLRRAHVTPKSERADFTADVGARLGRVLQTGGLFIIDLDDSDCTYLEKFYPNIKAFYSSESLPPQIWSKAEVALSRFSC